MLCWVWPSARATIPLKTDPSHHRTRRWTHGNMEYLHTFLFKVSRNVFVETLLRHICAAAAEFGEVLWDGNRKWNWLVKALVYVSTLEKPSRDFTTNIPWRNISTCVKKTRVFHIPTVYPVTPGFPSYAADSIIRAFFRYFFFFLYLTWRAIILARLETDRMTAGKNKIYVDREES